MRRDGDVKPVPILLDEKTRLFSRRLIDMPRKPRGPCGHPSCPLLAVRDGYCAEHYKAATRHYNQYQRDPASNKRYGRAWKRIRDRYISRHPLCEECVAAGRLTPAEEVHHVVPLAQGGDHAQENLMALCKSCHSRITLRDSVKGR